MQSGLLPDAAVGGGVGPGCFTHLKGIATTRGQLWWWETIMTFLLVSVGTWLSRRTASCRRCAQSKHYSMFHWWACDLCSLSLHCRQMVHYQPSIALMATLKPPAEGANSVDSVHILAFLSPSGGSIWHVRRDIMSEWTAGGVCHCCDKTRAWEYRTSGNWVYAVRLCLCG